MLTASTLARRLLPRQTALAARAFSSSNVNVDGEHTPPPELDKLVIKAVTRQPYDPAFHQAVQQIQLHYPDATPAQIQAAAGNHKVLSPLLTALRKGPVPFVSVDPALEAAIKVYESEASKPSQLNAAGKFFGNGHGNRSYSTTAVFQPLSEEEINFQRLIRWAGKLDVDHPSMPAIVEGLNHHIQRIGGEAFLARTRGLPGIYDPVLNAIRAHSQAQKAVVSAAPEPKPEKLYVKMSHLRCDWTLDDYKEKDPKALFSEGKNGEQIPYSPTETPGSRPS